LEKSVKTEQFILPNPQGAQTVVVKANGGSVVAEKLVGADWVVVDTFSTDGAWRLELGRTATRFTPSGGAAYVVSK
jgi:hypothetical protein